jgi:DNA-binding response OmpR family regulator
MTEILVIDDEPQMRRLIARILTGAGHTVHQANDGRNGIELFHRVHPGLVITDIVMPDMEGIEMIRELHQEAPEIPILAISGGGPEVYLRAATGLGATAALAKPFGAAELLSVVERLLKGSRASQPDQGAT